MTEQQQIEERRMSDPALSAITERLKSLQIDMTDMKIGLKDMAIAITKLAVMEERQLSANQALDRAHKALERNESCIEKVSERVAALEKVEPVRTMTGGWVVGAVWALAGAAALFVAKKVGLA